MNALTTTIESTLDELSPGSTGKVLTVAGDDAIARRLSDLGFWAGTDVVVVRRAPFGDPVEYFLRGYRLALRRAEARRILVSTLP